MNYNSVLLLIILSNVTKTPILQWMWLGLAVLAGIVLYLKPIIKHKPDQAPTQ